ncbi:MAG: sugar isomerase, partial [Actinomycetota bacterium]|nr:sugar isomerase [Actinomycetota bacterium]
ATDVRPLCAKVREDMGAAANPIAAFKQSGYAERVAVERAEGVGAGWG